ncbi:MAG: RDD family protein [Candidatus Acidiferrales bacterium]
MMFCSKCGAAIPEGASFCNVCGQAMQGGGAVPLPPADPMRGNSGWQAADARRLTYAGFWLRLVAYILDSIILGFVIGLLIFLPLMSTALRGVSPDRPWEFYTAMGPQMLAVRGLVLMASWLYFALLESSAWQGTLGKRALGLLVTDLEGRRVSFGRASGRYFGKIVSALILMIGFIMAGFTEKKQALHDMLAGCLVLRKL